MKGRMVGHDATTTVNHPVVEADEEVGSGDLC